MGDIGTVQARYEVLGDASEPPLIVESLAEPEPGAAEQAADPAGIEADG